MKEFFCKLKNMSEDEFFGTVFPIVGVSHELSKVISGGVSLLKRDEKMRLLDRFEYLGAPAGMSDKDIRNVCRYIAKRIFSVPRQR